MRGRSRQLAFIVMVLALGWFATTRYDAYQAENYMASARSHMSYFDSQKQDGPLDETELLVRFIKAEKAYADFKAAKRYGADPGWELLDAQEKVVMYRKALQEIPKRYLRAYENGFNKFDDVIEKRRNMKPLLPKR